jgi:hypothetical protein
MADQTRLGLKPDWGKLNVRNFREGAGNVTIGSRTEAHGESRGHATGPSRGRVSALPGHREDGERVTGP